MNVIFAPPGTIDGPNNPTPETFALNSVLPGLLSAFTNPGSADMASTAVAPVGPGRRNETLSRSRKCWS